MFKYMIIDQIAGEAENILTDKVNLIRAEQYYKRINRRSITRINFEPLTKSQLNELQDERD